MKRTTYSLAAALAAILILGTACSTTDARIKDHQAAFDASPAPVQAKIKAGQVDIGFSQAQVLMALGEPDRRYTRTTAEGTVEIWAYRDHAPSISLGVGFVGGGGGTMMGSGMSVSSRGDRNDDKLRVVLSAGTVIAIESQKSR